MEANDFEGRLEEAKQILEKLMNPEMTLEESVKAYESGTKALKEAQRILEEARKKIEQIRSGEETES
ncbi:exodeoxyribonuclease VII small subunit [Sulfurimonas sp. HSL-3221]|uniref:exodeoxyribonuclease VII small subunit n=1 Tax=Sulfurimonadaceae TaxID=2771471 RepID=UPI001E2C443D|nr:exodeoxyribonuclease VII small subunit [Sulfurimonas sp. HSL-3221]UFS61766.1 exodeoxyribonuclease VII small subunit [Sulfurimonas sp. HSL-3221]